MPEEKIHKTGNVGLRLRKMSPAQQGRIFALRNRIKKCEGNEMPYKYWCKSCKAVWNKINDVFVKFERINERRSREHMYDTSIPNGFSKPDSTESGYNG